MTRYLFGETPADVGGPSDSSSTHFDNGGGRKPAGCCEKWMEIMRMKEKTEREIDGREKWGASCSALNQAGGGGGTLTDFCY